MEDTVKIELTEEERGYICTALNDWSWNNPYMDEEIYNKITTLIEKIVNAY